MDRVIEISCPYCGHENRAIVKDDYREMQIVNCDCEYGGCDRYFVAEITIRFTTQCKRIEGEEATHENN